MLNVLFKNYQNLKCTGNGHIPLALMPNFGKFMQSSTTNDSDRSHRISYREKLDYISRKFKPPPKKQDRRRNGILFTTPSFISTPDSFFPANWPPLQQASQLFPVCVLYYIIFVNCNIIKYTLLNYFQHCLQTRI